MSGLTCNTAPGQSFTTMEELKAHYKTDWHRYNLKRKVFLAHYFSHGWLSLKVTSCNWREWKVRDVHGSVVVSTTRLQCGGRHFRVWFEPGMPYVP
jgi:hypothetical protein